MDDSQKIASLIIQWIREHQKMLSLDLIGYQWPNFLDLDFFNCSIKCAYEKEYVVGAATGVSAELALIKAMAEIVERVALIQSSCETSNGFAAHSAASLALLSAKRELVERDAFLSHYLLQKNPIAVDPEKHLSDLALECCRFYKSKKIEIQLGQLMTANEEFVFLVVGTGVNAENAFGFTLGMGCGDTIEDAAEKAFWECHRHLIGLALDFSRFKSITLDEFNRLPSPNPCDHTALSLNLDYAKHTMEWLEPIPLQNSFSLQLPVLEFEQKIIQIPKPFDLLPLTVAHATCDLLQGLFFGKTMRESVNINRYSSLGEIQWEKVLKFPHPLG